MRPWIPGGAALVTAVLGSCQARHDAVTSSALSCTADVALDFRADLPTLGDERYLCYGFDSAALSGRGIHAMDFAAVPAAGVIVHHLALYAVPGEYPVGPADCEDMPVDAVQLHVWAGEGDPLDLPPGVDLVIPAAARRLVVQAHVLRTRDGPAAEGAVEFCTSADPPQHTAGWFRAPAPVPAIRPHTREQTTARCRVAGPVHVVSTWPHMHRLGQEFHGAVVRADGSREALVDVAPWQFEQQRTYPVGLDLAAGDAIETTCVWFNPGDDYVLPGPRISDEMCAQSLVAWPAEYASCQLE